MQTREWTKIKKIKEKRKKKLFNVDISHFQIFICEEMAFTQKTSNRISPQARMEGLLGLFKGYHLAVLSMRFARRTIRWIGTETSHYCWWCYYATDSRTSQTWLHILPKYGLWGCLFVSSSLSGECIPRLLLLLLILLLLCLLLLLLLMLIIQIQWMRTTPWQEMCNCAWAH